MGHPQQGRTYRWGRLKSAIVDQYLAIYLKNGAREDIVTIEGE